MNAGSSDTKDEMERKWNRPAVLQLLEQVKLHYSQLTDKVTKNTTVWKTIAHAVKEIPGVTQAQCNQKWRNLKLKYKKYIDNQSKTGRGR